jgi:hypothetical protein
VCRAFEFHNAATTVVRDNTGVDRRLADETVGAIDRGLRRMGLRASNDETLIIEGLVSNDMGF